VLSDVGRRVSFLRGSAVEGDSYDDIVLAANLFSQHQTGALMVIEREIGLRTYIESGVAMDARLSYDLLATIFRPSAPLHDGAVIIQKDRIAAAACFLPLTTTPALARELGTRHRAAIGITEETDCLSLVVSEETGRISVCAFGELVQGLSLAEVRERINRHFEVLHPGSIRIEESPADIPLATDGVPRAAENRPAERVNQP